MIISPSPQPDVKSAPVDKWVEKGMSEVRVKKWIRELTVGRAPHPCSKQHPVMTDGHGK